MKKMIGLVLILFSVLLLAACSNPQGGFGPSWDVGMKVPLTRDQEVTAQEIFEDMEGINLEGEVATLNETQEMESVDIGSCIEDIDLTAAAFNTGGNFPLADGEVEINEDDIPVTLDLPEIGFTLETVTFSGGTLNLSITPSGGATVNFKSVDIGGVSADWTEDPGDSVEIDLNGQSLNMIYDEVSEQYSIAFTITLNVSGALGDTASLIMDFNTPVVASISAEFAEYGANDILPAGFENPEIDLSSMGAEEGFFEKVSFNDLDVDLIINNNTELIVDLSSIEFAALNNSDELIDSFILGELNGAAANVGYGESRLSLLTADEQQSDFLDLLQAYPARVEILLVDESEGGFTVDSGGQAVIIDTGSALDVSFALKLGFDLTLKEEQEELVYERESIEGFRVDELVDKVFDSARLVLQDFDNQLPVELEVSIYLADIPGESTMLDKEFEESLFHKDNKLSAHFTLEARTAEPVDKEVVIVDSSILDKFTGENLFSGFKLVMPTGDYRFESDDSVNIGEVYGSFVFKVNQLKQ